MALVSSPPLWQLPRPHRMKLNSNSWQQQQQQHLARIYISHSCTPFLLITSSSWIRNLTLAHRSGGGGISNLELEVSSKPFKRRSGNALYLLLLVNLGIFAADHWFQIDAVKKFYLYHGMPRWHQFITATFCHCNWSHLSSNLFFLYMFGKLVEEEEGSFGLWASYIVTGAGANIVSWLLLPRTVISVGASGAVFGLFVISVLVKVSWDWRKLLEVLILGQFVVDKVMEAARSSAVIGSASTINHVAHFAGALLGALVVLLLSKLPKSNTK